MRAFTCPVCRVLVTFESLECLHSATPLGFDWQRRDVVELQAGAHCANRDVIACNGLAGPDGLCASCTFTRTRPNNSDADGLEKFAIAEAAKRRLLFELLEIGLPVDDFRHQPGGLAFDMLSGSVGPVTTGHADGIITLDVDEADPARREQIRSDLDEPYRTVLGHLRHEIGHYYQPLLAPERSAERDRCRDLFGDDREDYSAAMERHYAGGAPADWSQNFVSAYATMHPWEDWAETFAHYLHIRDVLQTAIHYGVSVAGPSVAAADEAPLYSYPAAFPHDFLSMLDAWLPLTYALNAINRSIGDDDLYPFVLSPPVVNKLAYIDQLVRP